MLKKKILILVLVAVGLLLSGMLLSGCGNSSVEVISFEADPAKQAPDTAVNINVGLNNTGEKSSKYKLVLKVNDIRIQSRAVTIEAGQTEMVNFMYFGHDYGTYQVDVNGYKTSFQVVRPPEFVIESLNIITSPAIVGQEIQATARIRNDGEAAGTFSGQVIIDGNRGSAVEADIEPGSTVDLPFSFVIAETGKHKIAFNEITETIEIFSPANFEITQFSISPEKVLSDHPATVSAVVTNTGGIEGEKTIEFKVTGATVEEKLITLKPGESQKVEFSVQRSTDGKVTVGIDDVSGLLAVINILEYENLYYHYKIPYLEDYHIEEYDQNNVYFGNNSGEGLLVVTERLNGGTTPREYLDSVLIWKKSVLDKWEASNIDWVMENENIIGYQYDYSYLDDDNVRWIGRGMTVTRQVLGYDICFETKDVNWDKYGILGQQLVENFESLEVITGKYRDENTGAWLVLPENWGLIDLKNFDSSFPLEDTMAVFIAPPYAQTVNAHLAYKTVEPGVSFDDNIDETLYTLGIYYGLTVLENGSFETRSGVSGYKIVISYDIYNLDYEIVLYYMVEDTHNYNFLFIGPTDEMEELADSMENLVKSLRFYYDMPY